MPLTYKSFCWSIGTTSFRTKDFNRTIEVQLSLLNEFWGIEENQAVDWVHNNDIQTKYYNFMQAKEFVEGDAGNKPKDAREKTSGLVDIGLIDDNRRLTSAGKALLSLSEAGDFHSDNHFEIPKDSFIYLKQLLKMSCKVDTETVRPFIVMLYVLSKVGKMSLDEFTYLLPLCINRETTDEIILRIEDVKSGSTTVDEIIISRLLSMDNYKEAINLFLSAESVDECLICQIGMNRKSRSYDKLYFALYQALHKAYIQNDKSAFVEAYDVARAINIGGKWIKYLFGTATRVSLVRNAEPHIKPTAFDNVTNEADFRTAFFKIMHLLKAKATLHDYLDLNRRYIKTTDIVLFEDDTVRLDVVPKHFFKSVMDVLYEQAYISSDLLYDDCKLKEISNCLIINDEVVIKCINAELGITATTIDNAREALEFMRYKRFRWLIDNKFSDEKLLLLLSYFDKREDAEIRRMVTYNADVPTIFEYVLGILWYKVSEYQGKILDYMKLSLDADLLPKTHASGGDADIVYEYPETESYPEHTLLLEATLADSSNQRRMEMEPVSRHLGQHLLRTGNRNSYCVFATGRLNINVIADFRSRKNIPYYDTQDYSKSVSGMKIIPLQNSELKAILTHGKHYKDLYSLFEAAFVSELPPHEWYNQCLANQVK
ncbi:MAG: AlwI family type II restriction endonuclease [Clostridiales bacterium]|nr:AlwI family type II restriction endonuclease [Clostridiales bacterium]